MTTHALVQALSPGLPAADYQRAQGDADAVEILVAEAVTIPDASDASCARLRELVRAIEVLIAPWRSQYPVYNLVTWHEHVRALLFAQAVKMVGPETAHLLAPPPTEQLGQSSPILPSLTRRTGGPSMFGLR
jgi:hypothetical protein